MKKAIWLLGSTLGMVMLMAFFAFNIPNENNMTQKVVDLNVLYSNFNMTKELGEKYNSISSKRISVMDSLSQELHILQASAGSSSNASIPSDIYQKYAMVEAQLVELKKIDQNIQMEFENQIWNQLNTYILEFGKSHDYPLILGSKRDGNILYVNDDNDITSEITLFVNNKYKGN